MSQTRGRPFQPGNRFGRGRPKGSRNKRSAQAQEILDQFAEPLVKRCVAKGLEGDARALALCMERLLPALREPGVRLRLPKLNNLKDVNLALKQVLQATARGEVTPVEAEKIANALGNYRQAIEGHEVIARIEELEKRASEQERKSRR